MGIGIVGSGKICATAARLFAEAGHEVAISNSRGPESLASMVEEVGPPEHAPRPSRRQRTSARWCWRRSPGSSRRSTRCTSKRYARRGGDGEAKAVVSRLIEEIGFAPVDTGSLSDGRKHEPGSPIHNVPMDPERARETTAGMR
jgi:predicted dinucleotide-binding enzyme